VIEWARDELARRGMRVTGEPTVIHEKPWATVARIPTDDGATFVKATIPALGHEPAVTSLLARVAPELVTPLIAHDETRRFLLMEDAGERLRATIERDRDIRHWHGILPLYAEIQLKAMPFADHLVAAGAPDMRASALPALFDAVVNGDELLTIAGPRSTLPDHLRRLRAQRPRVRAWSEALAVTVPETIQHDDLHDGQVFIRSGHARVLDWGDANVSTPFYSLVVLERSVAYTFELAPDAPELGRLRDEYLEPFTAVATRAQIEEARRLAMLLGRLVRALTWTALVRTLPPDHEDAEAAPGWFELFLEAAEAF
jgi:hypothetical protein